MKQTDVVIDRHHIEKIEGVSRTWFEWDIEGKNFTKSLVVEVDFDTDPNSPKFRQSAMDAIVDSANGDLKNENTMIVSRIRIVPKS